MVEPQTCRADAPQAQRIGAQHRVICRRIPGDQRRIGHIRHSGSKLSAVTGEEGLEWKGETHLLLAPYDLAREIWLHRLAQDVLGPAAAEQVRGRQLQA